MKYKTSISFSLKDLTPYNNIYFSRYIEAQGIVRERWVVEQGLGETFQEYKWITKKVDHVFQGEAEPFKDVDAIMTIEQINRASFTLKIELLQENRVLGIGKQLICFANKQDKLVKIPDEVREKLKIYCDN
jgi:acyl-CoA thioesterase FadM